MEHPIQSLHHVTATVDKAQPDLDFCERLLGLRLVKRTVNFDNHGVYHFYYGTESGAPGTIWTTFPYHGWGVAAGVHGAGQIVATAFSVPAGALDRWRARLEAAGAAAGPPRFGAPTLTVRDPSGLVLELVADGRDTRAAWGGGGLDGGAAIRGLHSVTLLLRAPAATVQLMTTLLGFEVVAESAGERAWPSEAMHRVIWWTWCRIPMPPPPATGSAPCTTSRSRSRAPRSSCASGASSSGPAAT